MAKDKHAPVAGATPEIAMKYFQDLCDLVDQKAKGFPPLVKLAKTVNTRPCYIVVAVAAFLLAFLLFGIGGELICNAVGFVYPAYQSFKAIESKRSDDDQLWLTYWVVYAAFSVVETFVDFILFWVPMYFIFKLAFLVWLFLPQTKGALIVYTTIIRPFLEKHRNSIDSAIGSVTEGTSGLVDTASGMASQAAGAAAKLVAQGALGAKRD